MKKRIFSIFMAALMVISMPGGVQAVNADEPQRQDAYASSGKASAKVSDLAASSAGATSSGDAVNRSAHEPSEESSENLSEDPSAGTQEETSSEPAADPAENSPQAPAEDPENQNNTNRSGTSLDPSEDPEDEAEDSDNAGSADEAGSENAISVQNLASPLEEPTAGNVVTGTWTMTRHVYGSPTILGTTTIIPPVDGMSASRTINYTAASASYIPLPGQQGTYTFSKVNNIINWQSDYHEQNYYANGLILPCYFVLRELVRGDGPYYGSLGDELLDWGNANGLDWTSETALTNVKAQFRYAYYFEDGNGNPADFLDVQQDDVILQPYVDWWSQPYNSDVNMKAGDETTMEYDSHHVVITESNITYVHPYHGNYQVLVPAEEMHFGCFPYMEMICGTSSGGWHFNKNYLGTLKVIPRLEAELTFEVDGTPYDITLYTPDISQTFEVVPGVYTHEISQPESDLKATVTHDGVTSEVMTESDKVTLVEHNDIIDYQIDMTSDVEEEMFYQLYEALCKMKARRIYPEMPDSITLIEPYTDVWTQAVWNEAERPRIKVDFTIPDGLAYSQDQLAGITLEQSKPDSPRWHVDQTATTYTHAEDGSTCLHLELTMDDQNSMFPSNMDKVAQNGADMLNQFKDDTYTLKIPGVQVSPEAEFNRYYTAKATVTSHFHLAYEGIMGTSVPAGAKPSTGDENWDDDGWGDEGWDDDGWDDDGWDDEEDVETEWDEETDEDLTSLMQEVCTAETASSAPEAASTAAPLSSTTPDPPPQSRSGHMYTPDDFTKKASTVNYNAEDVAPSLDYRGIHCQTSQGKDVIQQEEHSNELWYTVRLSGVTVSKTVTGDASDKDRQSYFHFTLSAGEDQASTSHRAILTTVEEDGSSSTYPFTAHFNDKGDYSFHLKHNQSVLVDLPEGTAYTITERHASAAYEVSVTGGEVAPGAVTEDQKGTSYCFSGIVDGSFNDLGQMDTAAFVNHKKPEKPQEPPVPKTTSPPKTGDTFHTPAWMLILVLASGLAVIAYRRKSAFTARR